MKRQLVKLLTCKTVDDLFVAAERGMSFVSFNANLRISKTVSATVIIDSIRERLSSLFFTPRTRIDFVGTSVISSSLAGLLHLISKFELSVLLEFVLWFAKVK